MTTRAGFIGFLTGLVITMTLVYPLVIAASTHWIWIGAAAVITTSGGALAGRWSGAVQPIRCAALGGLAGGVAGIIFFCLLGAAAASLIAVASAAAIVILTHKIFLVSFLGGIELGALGGWMTYPRHENQKDVFDKSEPQMALNAAITAVPASVIAAALAAAIFSRMAESTGDKAILDLSLIVSLLLVLLSHFALTLVIPHEAREAESRCGMDEVKMAAYVGIGAAPVLALLLSMAGSKLFLNPRVIFALIISAIMSLRALQLLFKLILPRRDSFPLPQNDLEQMEAKFFGTIADSSAPRLIVLCIGCGAVMLLPLYITVFSVLINLTQPRKFFLTQALTSTGLVIASIIILTAIYLLYLNLGRWFKKWRLRRSGHGI
jgi:hypothetical protein